MGGGQLAAAFQANDLITQYVISLIPIILGQGIPLFAFARRIDEHALTDVTTHARGIVQLYYEPGARIEARRVVRRKHERAEAV